MFKRLFPWMALAGLASQAALALDPPAFVAVPSNACQPHEKRSACFLRYTVKKTSPKTPGKSNYQLANTNLKCPSGYSLQGELDNRLQDVASPNDEIHYYDGGSFMPASAAELAQAQASFMCTPSGPVAVYEVPTEWTGLSCGDYPPTKVVDGHVAVRFAGRTWSQDTYTSGARVCEHYTLAGCPDAWCARLPWVQYIYMRMVCTRSAGAYLARESPEQSPNPAYSPSVIICGKI